MAHASTVAASPSLSAPPAFRPPVGGVAPVACQRPPPGHEPPSGSRLSRLPPVNVTVYAYECDAYGHLNEAAFMQVFERARWETLARGPGIELFRRHELWPAVRKASVEYHHPAFPGDVLEIHTE